MVVQKLSCLFSYTTERSSQRLQLSIHIQNLSHLIPQCSMLLLV